MRIAVKIAGFSLARADTLRKAMGKKQQGAHRRAGRALRLRRRRARATRTPRSRRCGSQIVPFAQYGFNKSHSVAYAFVAYQTAYLKAHYPLHFWAAMLSSEIANTEKLAAYVTIAAASVGHHGSSGPTSTPRGLAVHRRGRRDQGRAGGRQGGGGGRRRGDRAGARARSDSFTSAVPHAALAAASGPSTARWSSAWCGPVRSTAFTRTAAALVAGLDRLVRAGHPAAPGARVGQGFLFALDPRGAAGARATLCRPGRSTARSCCEGERETLGFYLSGHPLDRWTRVLRELRATPGRRARRAVRRRGAERAVVAGLVTGLKVAADQGRAQPGPPHGLLQPRGPDRQRCGSWPSPTSSRSTSGCSSTGRRCWSPRACARATASTSSCASRRSSPLEGIEERRASGAADRARPRQPRRPGARSTASTTCSCATRESSGSACACVGDEWRADVLPNRVVGVDPEHAPS